MNKKTYLLFLLLTVVFELIYLLFCFLKAHNFLESMTFVANNIRLLAIIIPIYLLIINLIWFPEKKSQMIFRYIFMISILLLFYLVHILGTAFILSIKMDGLGLAIIEIGAILSFSIVTIGWVIIVILKNCTGKKER